MVSVSGSKIYSKLWGHFSKDDVIIHAISGSTKWAYISISQLWMVARLRSYLDVISQSMLVVNVQEKRSRKGCWKHSHTTIHVIHAQNFHINWPLDAYQMLTVQRNTLWQNLAGVFIYLCEVVIVLFCSDELLLFIDFSIIADDSRFVWWHRRWFHRVVYVCIVLHNTVISTR